MPDPAECGFRPFPGNGAYGHWTCQLPSRHRGRHRFNNYTIPRVPRIHHGIDVVARSWFRHRRRVLRHVIKYRKVPRVDLSPNYGSHWRSHVWAPEYDPIPKDSERYA